MPRHLGTCRVRVTSVPFVLVFLLRACTVVTRGHTVNLRSGCSPRLGWRDCVMVLFWPDIGGLFSLFDVSPCEKTNN